MLKIQPFLRVSHSRLLDWVPGRVYTLVRHYFPEPGVEFSIPALTLENLYYLDDE